MQRRWKLSLAQRADMWNRWKAGESLNAIGRVLGKDKQIIHFLLARHGGIAPAARRRSPRVLTLAEREDILRGIASGQSLRAIAKCSLERMSPPESKLRWYVAFVFTTLALTIISVVLLRLPFDIPLSRLTYP